MGYAVLHIEKGTAGKAGGLGKHIERTKLVLNADPSKTQYNVFFRQEGEWVKFTQKAHPLNLQERIDKRIAEGYKGKTKIRKDAVTHLNIVLTGSHDDMIELMQKGKLQDWVMKNYQFVAKRFGLANIVEFAVHLDERTPHIHCVVVPLTADGRLSAKEVMGDRRKLSATQEEYGAIMEQEFGLKRGVKGSTATHDSVREYYGRMEEALKKPRKIIDEIKLKNKFVSLPPLAPWKRESWQIEQNKAIREEIMQIVSNYTTEAEEAAEKALQTQRIVDFENAKRLRQRNCQLEGIIRQQVQAKNETKEKKQRTEIEKPRKRGRGLS